jgi:hypothetical protein
MTMTCAEWMKANLPNAQTAMTYEERRAFAFGWMAARMASACAPLTVESPLREQEAA